MTVVCLVGSAVVIVGRRENENVVAAAERIPVEHNRTQEDVRVVARGLVGGGTVKVPVGELAQVGDLVRDRLKGKGGVEKGRIPSVDSELLTLLLQRSSLFPPIQTSRKEGELAEGRRRKR